MPFFERVVIETTGLADPAPVVGSFISDPHVQHLYALEHVITTVDAVHGLREPESVKQTVVADRLVITKTDIAEAGELTIELRGLNPTAAIVEAPFGDVEPGWLASTGQRSTCVMCLRRHVRTLTTSMPFASCSTSRSSGPRLVSG